MAFDITPDHDHKFELALGLNKIDEAFKIAEEQESHEKWKKVGDIALNNGNFELAERCFEKSQDFNSMLLFYSSYGDEEGLTRLVEQSERSGKYNVALEAAYLLGDADRCIKILLKSKRVAEAAMFARAYAPSKIPTVMK
jgi:coatomer subunit beta'